MEWPPSNLEQNQTEKSMVNWEKWNKMKVVNNITVKETLWKAIKTMTSEIESAK